MAMYNGDWPFIYLLNYPRYNLEDIFFFFFRLFVKRGLFSCEESSLVVGGEGEGTMRD